MGARTVVGRHGHAVECPRQDAELIFHSGQEQRRRDADRLDVDDGSVRHAHGRIAAAVVAAVDQTQDAKDVLAQAGALPPSPPNKRMPHEGTR